MARYVFEKKLGAVRSGIGVYKSCRENRCINIRHMKLMIPGFKSPHPHTRLTDDDVMDIQESKDTIINLAKIHGVGTTTIHRITRGYRGAVAKRSGAMVCPFKLSHLLKTVGRIGPAPVGVIGSLMWTDREHEDRYSLPRCFTSRSKRLLSQAKDKGLVKTIMRTGREFWKLTEEGMKYMEGGNE